MPTAKPLPKIAPDLQQALYARYITPVAALGDGLGAGKILQDTPRLAANEYYTPNVHIISDVIAWSYLGALKPLPDNSVMTMLRLLDDGAKRECANLKLAHKKSKNAHERVFGVALVEAVLTEMYENGEFSGDFLLYHTMAVMQMSVVLQDIEKMDDAQQMHHFISMRVCLERANFSQILLLQSKLPPSKELASKGGKGRFIALYGPAHAYTKQRYAEILAAKPSTSKMQIAKMINEEAETRAEFHMMFENNRERTIYNWVLKL